MMYTVKNYVFGIVFEKIGVICIHDYQGNIFIRGQTLIFTIPNSKNLRSLNY